jgi:AcrR family transcriptional regulator
LARDHRPLAQTEPVAHDARLEIIAAGIRCLVRDGLEGTSMAAIALEARVSKALLHYHFTDRAHLVGEVARLLGRRLQHRERSVFARGEATAAMDLLWKWLSGELARGELRALLLLGTLREDVVTEATRAVNAARHESMLATIDELFTRLRLTPRVAAAIIAEAAMTFNEGLALRRHVDLADARTSFDVFWLAILSLGE